MFQGLEVVPVKFADKVIDLIKSGKGIEVHRYLVPLPYWKFFALKNKFGEIFTYRNHKTLIANLKYTHELGLVDAVEDEVINII